MQNIGSFVRLHRQLAGLTQRQLAMKSGLTENAIQKIESGTRIPRADTLHSIVDALELEIIVRRKPHN